MQIKTQYGTILTTLLVQPTGKLTWQAGISPSLIGDTFSNKGSMFRCYVSLPECNRTILTLWVGLCETTFLFVCVPASPRKGGLLRLHRWKLLMEKNHQVIYLIIYRGFIHPRWVVWDFWTINSFSAERRQGFFVSPRRAVPLNFSAFWCHRVRPGQLCDLQAKIHPLKINGWNMSSWRFGRSFSFQNGWFVGSMLIFQGVSKRICRLITSVAPKTNQRFFLRLRFPWKPIYPSLWAHWSNITWWLFWWLKWRYGFISQTLMSALRN